MIRPKGAAGWSAEQQTLECSWCCCGSGVGGRQGTFRSVSDRVWGVVRDHRGPMSGRGGIECRQEAANVPVHARMRENGAFAAPPKRSTPPT